MVDLLIFSTFTAVTQPKIFNDDDTFWPLFSFFVIQGVGLAIFEMVQLKNTTNLRTYLFNIWNLSDLMKMCSLWYYVITIYQSKDTHDSPKMTAFLSFLLFFKIFMGLNQFRSMRVLFNLVLEVAKDMSTFAGFLILAFILFGTTLFQISI